LRKEKGKGPSDETLLGRGKCTFGGKRRKNSSWYVLERARSKRKKKKREHGSERGDLKTGKRAPSSLIVETPEDLRSARVSPRKGEYLEGK